MSDEKKEPREVSPLLGSDALAALAAAVADASIVRASEIVRDGWFDLLRESNPLLREIFDRLPPEALREAPLLATFAGLLYYGTPYRRAKGLRLLVGATRAAADGSHTLAAIDRALILTSASVAYRLLGRPALGVKPARSAVRILREMPDEDLRAVHALPRVYSHLGTTLYFAGQVDEALSVFEYGLAEVPRNGYPHGFMNLAMLAGIHALQGDLPESATYLAAAREPGWLEASRSTYPGTFYRIAEAVVALERFDASAARGHLEALVHDRSTIEYWIPIAVTEALIDLVGGRPGEGLAGIDGFAASREGEGRSATARSSLAPTRALLQLAMQSADAALVTLLRDAAPGAARSIALARTELALGHQGAALQYLRRIAGSRISSRLNAEATVIETASVLRVADPSSARPLIVHLGAILETSRQRLALALIPAGDYRRVTAALAEEGYAHLLDGLPATSLIPDQRPEEILSPRELAVLQALMTTPSAATIAAELVVSVNTVKTQMRSIYRKLGVSTRDEAIAVALARHLAIADPPASTRRHR